MKNTNYLALLVIALISSNTLFAQDAPTVRTPKNIIKVAPIAQKEIPAALKNAAELQKEIEALEAVDRVYVQLSLPEEPSKAVALIQSFHNKINDEVINQIKTMISAKVDGLEVKNITVVEMNVDRMRKELNHRIRPSFGHKPLRGGMEMGPRGEMPPREVIEPQEGMEPSEGMRHRYGKGEEKGFQPRFGRGKPEASLGE